MPITRQWIEVESVVDELILYEAEGLQCPVYNVQFDKSQENHLA